MIKKIFSKVVGPLLVVAMLLSTLAMTQPVSAAPAQAETCGWWQNNQPKVNGAGHPALSQYGAVALASNGSVKWTRSDIVSALSDEDAVGLCPGLTLPAGTPWPPTGPAPRSLETNGLLVIQYVINPDGSITITSVTDTGVHGARAGNGWLDVTPEPLVILPVGGAPAGDDTDLSPNASAGNNGTINGSSESSSPKPVAIAIEAGQPIPDGAVGVVKDTTVDLVCKVNGSGKLVCTKDK